MKWLNKIIFAPFEYWLFSRMRGIYYIEFAIWVAFGIIIGLMF